MKTFSFFSGNKADATRGMDLVIDRRGVPSDVKLGVWIDDGGTAGGGNGGKGGTTTACCPTEIVLLDRARIRAKIGGIEGVITLEPGSRFDVAPSRAVGAVAVQGGALEERSGRRFATVTDPTGVIQIDKQPNAVHLLTLEADNSAAKNPGRYSVRIMQRAKNGVVVGGITVTFALASLGRGFLRHRWLSLA